MTAPHMPQMNDEGLLECAHCGELTAYNAISASMPKVKYYVICASCEIRTASFIRNDLAIKAWNTRSGYLWTKQDFKDAAWERHNSDLLEDK